MLESASVTFIATVVSLVARYSQSLPLPKMSFGIGALFCKREGPHKRDFSFNIASRVAGCARLLLIGLLQDGFLLDFLLKVDIIEEVVAFITGVVPWRE
mmetsp:Transcript_23814/g.31882  ORF Transcript_23814/g.31882 Transcript_23814/m.31882 type:complete len:99 (-) Transcript_23814:712-1008(-)